MVELKGCQVDFEVRDVVEPNGALVVAVRGELDLGNIDELRRRMGIRFGNTVPAVIDLSECTFIDSTGLSLLVDACKRAEEEGLPSHIVVAPPGGQVRRALGLSNLETRLTVMDSREAAVSVAEPRGLRSARAPAHGGQPPFQPRARR